MIHPGLCSISLSHISALEVIGLCQETGLTHIEWWGRDQGHVPPGDIITAQSVGLLLDLQALGFGPAQRGLMWSRWINAR